MFARGKYRSHGNVFPISQMPILSTVKLMYLARILGDLIYTTTVHFLTNHLIFLFCRGPSIKIRHGSGVQFTYSIV